MTLKELFIASVNGFPEVMSEIPVYNATSNIGLVVEIKVYEKHSGCGVRFPGLKYICWFYAEDQDDKRKKYMKDLKLVKPVNPYIERLLNPPSQEQLDRGIYGSWFVDQRQDFKKNHVISNDIYIDGEEKFRREYMQQPVDRPMFCRKPNCNCLNVEEAKQGGPVKNYPCLVDVRLEKDMQKMKIDIGQKFPWFCNTCFKHPCSCKK